MALIVIMNELSSGSNKAPVHPDKVHGANMGPTWFLSVPGGPHVDLMNLVIWAGDGPKYTGYAALMALSCTDIK